MCTNQLLFGGMHRDTIWHMAAMLVLPSGKSSVSSQSCQLQWQKDTNPPPPHWRKHTENQETKQSDGVQCLDKSMLV